MGDNRDSDSRRVELSPVKQALLEKLRRSAGSRSAAKQIEARDEIRPAPLSSMQERLWYVMQADENCGAYNIPLAYRLAGALDVSALEQSLNDVISRHEILRSTFALDGEATIQVVNSELTLEIEIDDFRSSQVTGREETIRSRLQELAGRPFDLRNGPLIHAHLLMIGEVEHILVVIVHHTVFDGESVSTFQREFSACYLKRVAGLQPDLPPLDLQYGDFSVWEREQPAEKLEQELEFWKKKLVEPLPILAMPAKPDRPREFSYEGNTQSLSLSPELDRALVALAESEAVSRFMILLALFQVLLSRYSGQSDIVVSSAFGLGERQVEPLIGFFANTLALRADLSGGPSFRKVLAQVRDNTLESLGNRHVPFDAVVRALKPERDQSRTPIFQAMLLLEDRDVEFTLGSVAATAIDVFPLGAATDLTLIARKSELHLNYCTDVFSEDIVAGFLASFECLIRGVVDNPSASILEIPLIDESESLRILERWRAPKSPTPPASTIHGLIEQQVDRTPAATAAIYESQSISYLDLEKRSNQLAHHLVSRGVGPNTIVALCLQRSIDMLVALLGIAKAGGAYVPMDPDFPEHRLVHMLEDSGAALLVTEEAVLDSIPATNKVAVTLVDVHRGAIEKEPIERPTVSLEPDQLAYVIYTSGSTGKPKGVEIPHRAVANFLWSMSRRPGIGPEDTLIAVTTLSFDIAVLELFLPLIVGAKTVIVDKETAADGSRLLEVVRASNATVMQATPATWHLMIEAGWNEKWELRALCGGEALPRNLATQLLDRARELWNMYGPTETTVWSTCCRIEDPKAIGIGSAIDNTQIYILDAGLKPVPNGVIGEVFIGGHGLANGYHALPALTDERFVPNPVMEGGKLFRTGDLARSLPDGTIQCLGRADSQIKIRGYRIELGEIETNLTSIDGVDNAVVGVVEAEGRGPELVAYMVTAKHEELSASELRGQLSLALPPYMVPQHFVTLPELPLTPNGKIDRNRLPELSTSVASKYEPPQGLERIDDPERWFWSLEWEQSALAAAHELEGLKWLIFVDDAGIGAALSDRLRQRRQLVTIVRSSDTFRRISDSEYCLNPEFGASQYHELVSALNHDDRLPDRIVHLWSLTKKQSWRPGSSFFHRCQEHGFYSLLFLSQAFTTFGRTKPLRLIVVSNGMQSVGGEKLAHPEKATLLGACKVIPHECSRQVVVSVDLDLNPEEVGRISNRVLVDSLELEVLSDSSESVVAFRDGDRWVQILQPVRSPFVGGASLKHGGAYIILAGLGDIGFAFGRLLVEQFEAKVVLVDSLKRAGNSSETPEHVRKFINNSDNVILLDADVSNPSDIRNAATTAREKLGTIDGVIDALIPREPARIAVCDADSLEVTFAPRVQTLRVLQELVQEMDLGLVVSFASTDLVCGRPGYAASAAADAFDNAMALAESANGYLRWLSIGWGEWAETVTVPSSLTRRDRETRSHVERDYAHITERGIDVDGAFQAFRWLVDSRRQHTLASSLDFEAQVDRIHCSALSDLKADGFDCVEPRNAVERKLAEIWAAVLNTEIASVRDNFFDLGGHSLLAVRLFARIKEEFGLAWPLSVLFAAPTIEAIAERISVESKDSDFGSPSGRFEYLVELHSGSDPETPPLFLIAGAYGNVLNLRHLSQLVGSERTVYGVQAQGLVGEAPPHESIEEAAQAYLTEILDIWPNGPYMFGGFCSGGIVALELARVLRARGAEVGLLAFLDTALPVAPDRLSLIDKAQLHWERMRRQGPGYLRSWARASYSWHRKRILEWFGKLKAENRDPTAFHSDAIYAATFRAMERYPLSTYDGSVLLYRPPLDNEISLRGGRKINVKREFLYEDNGWSRWIPHLEVHELVCRPGDHDAFVLEPYVRDLATKLKARLNDECVVGAKVESNFRRSKSG